MKYSEGQGDREVLVISYENPFVKGPAQVLSLPRNLSVPQQFEMSAFVILPHWWTTAGSQTLGHG